MRMDNLVMVCRQSICREKELTFFCLLQILMNVKKVQMDVHSYALTLRGHSIVDAIVVSVLVVMDGHV